MRIFNRTLVFDFGSSNTVVCDENGEVIFDEGTVIVYYAWIRRNRQKGLPFT